MPELDLLCAWCGKVLGVPNGEGAWTTTAMCWEFNERFYCYGETGDCWETLLGLASFVERCFAWDC